MLLLGISDDFRLQTPSQTDFLGLRPRPGLHFTSTPLSTVHGLPTGLTGHFLGQTGASDGAAATRRTSATRRSTPGPFNPILGTGLHTVSTGTRTVPGPVKPPTKGGYVSGVGDGFGCWSCLAVYWSAHPWNWESYHGTWDGGWMGHVPQGCSCRSEQKTWILQVILSRLYSLYIGAPIIHPEFEPTGPVKCCTWTPEPPTSPAD